MKKRLVITGGTKGLGRAIAEKFASEGFDIIMCARNQENLNDIKKLFKVQYPDCQLFIKKADLSKGKDVKAFADFVLQTWSDKIDVLMNNSGVFLMGGILTEAEGTLEKSIETNLYSAYNLTKYLLPTLLKQTNGHIFNMCSIASITAYTSGSAYSISKFAMLGFSKCLREELKDKGIKVTSILPGATWSDAWQGVTLPEDRLMQASDIAHTIWSAYQLSPSAVVEEIVLRPQLGDL